MQYIKEQIEKGNLQLAKMNQENKPIPMEYSELQEKQTTLNKRALLLQKLKTLSREEKEEWRHIKKLKANELYKNQKIGEAIELYLQALLGLDTGDETTRQSDNQFKYSILLNIATCLYKQKEYERGVEMCNKILEEEDGKTIGKAYFKKANLLLAASKFDQSKQTCLKGLKVIHNQKDQLGTTSISKKDFIRLLSEIESKTTNEKSMYQKMFMDSDDQEDSLLEKNGTGKENQQKILYYNDSLWSQIMDCCSSSFSWIRFQAPREGNKKQN